MADNEQKRLGEQNLLPEKVGNRLPAPLNHLPVRYDTSGTIPVGSAQAKNEEPRWKTMLYGSILAGLVSAAVWSMYQYEPKAEAPPPEPFNKMDITFNPNEKETLDGVLHLVRENEDKKNDTLSFAIMDYDITEALRREGRIYNDVVQARLSSAGIAADNSISGGGRLGSSITFSKPSATKSFSEEPVSYSYQSIHNVFSTTPSSVLQSETQLKNSNVLAVSRELAKSFKEEGILMYLIPLETKEANEIVNKLEDGKPHKFNPKR